MLMPSSAANPVGLTWQWNGNHKMYAMCRAPDANVGRPFKYKAHSNNWIVFGRVEPDATGQLVASATSFDHIKYVDSMEEGRLHVEAIWALEASSSAGGK